NDPLSGAYHLRARDYIASTGQFHSVDPLSHPTGCQSESTYVYANDNPLTGSDPSGLGCGIFAVVCNVASAAGHAITSAASTVLHTAAGAISTVAQAAAGAVNTVVQAATSAVQQGANLVKRTVSSVKTAVTAVRNTLVSATKAVVNHTTAAFHQAAVWVDKHKAQIASIAAAVAVGAACEAVTAGAGTIGCAALAGAVGSMVSYGMTTPSSQLTVGGFLTAGVIGGVTGALTGGAGVLLGRVA